MVTIDYIGTEKIQWPISDFRRVEDDQRKVFSVPAKDNIIGLKKTNTNMVEFLPISEIENPNSGDYLDFIEFEVFDIDDDDDNDDTDMDRWGASDELKYLADTFSVGELYHFGCIQKTPFKQRSKSNWTVRVNRLKRNKLRQKIFENFILNGNLDFGDWMRETKFNISSSSQTDGFRAIKRSTHVLNGEQDVHTKSGSEFREMSRLRKANVIILGASGCGKSSLINTIRGLGSYEENSAPIGVATRGTRVHQAYSWSIHPHVTFIDSPGYNKLETMGRHFEKIQDYLSKEILQTESWSHDCYLICFQDRFSGYDKQLVEKCLEMGKKFLIVGLKTDRLSEYYARKLGTFKLDEKGELDLIRLIKEQVKHHCPQVPDSRIFAISALIETQPTEGIIPKDFENNYELNEFNSELKKFFAIEAKCSN